MRILFALLLFSAFLIKPDTTINSYQKLTYARVWGIVNYFHYPVLDGKQNWNQILIDEIGKDSFSWDINELLKHVKIPEKTNWESFYDKTAANHFLDFIPVKESGFHTLDFSWLKDNPYLNNESKKKIGSIFSRYIGAKHVNCKKYPFAYVDDEFQNKIENPNEYVFGFIHTWNFFDFRNPYEKLLDYDWSEIFEQNIELIEKRTEESYKRALTNLTVGLQDDHALIYNKDEFGNDKLLPPFEFRIIDSQLVITNKLGYGNEFQTGDIIKEINGIRSNEIIEFGYTNFSLSKESNLETDIAFPFYFMNNDTTSEVIVSRNGKDLNVHCDNIYRREFFQKTHYFDEVIINHDGVKQLIIGSVKGNQVKSIIDSIKNDDRIILDCRQYIDEGTYPLSTFLTWKSLPANCYNDPVGKYPGVFGEEIIQRNRLKTLPDKKKQAIHDAQIVILIDENTQSASESTVMLLKTINDKVTIIGSPTSGADGTAHSIIVPGNFSISYTCHTFYFPDGKQLQRIGIQPDIYIKPSIEDYKNGRDPLLEKALEILNSKP